MQLSLLFTNIVAGSIPAPSLGIIYVFICMYVYMYIDKFRGRHPDIKSISCGIQDFEKHGAFLNNNYLFYSKVEVFGFTR